MEKIPTRLPLSTTIRCPHTRCPHPNNLSIKTLNLDTGVLAEVGNLVSCIGDVASCVLLKEVDIYEYGSVVEPMVEGGR